MSNLPAQLYTPRDVQRLDKLAIESGIPGYTLMRRAGRCVFNALQDYFPDAKNILVVCGAGNNAGDGYVVARLAQQQQLSVRVVSLVDPQGLKGDAKQAWLHWCECGEVSADEFALIDDADVIIDAMLGTGIDRDVEARWRDWIEALNVSARPVIAIDVPSGLDALTGAVHGAAVRADVTLSFIGLKPGLFTASGRACCGEIEFDALEVPAAIYASVKPFAELICAGESLYVPQRVHDSHKGDYGHILVIGGNYGMPGAVILAAKAALRSGAGMVSVITRPEHITAVAAACPEAMVHASVNGELPATLRSEPSVIAIGPGLGLDAWAHRLLVDVCAMNKPLVLDADALTMMAERPVEFSVPAVITPHPGEAARLLSSDSPCTAAEVQADRFEAARRLHAVTGASVVLKGSGSLVFDGNTLRVCAAGNPAMATAGMGDVLTGVIAACLALDVARGLAPATAAARGVCLHAQAGDLAAGQGASSLLASDVINMLPFVSVS